MDLQRTVTMWSANGLTVTARRSIDENLLINGQDLKSGAAYGTEVGEYEYGFSVPPGEVPKILDALNAEPDADVLDVLERYGPEVVEFGESRWLARIGVEAEFWSRIE